LAVSLRDCDWRDDNQLARECSQISGKWAKKMKSFRCGDVVAGCTASFTGSADDILVLVADHARQEHKLESVPPELIVQVRAAMQPA